jgi:branched-chain amino acid transport system ATP-binding protein
VTAAALQLERIRAGYGRLDVLHGVDLSVAAGTTIALLGANGAGKSTTLKVAAGLVRPRSGAVHLGGAALTRRPASRRAAAGLCYIPEGRGVFRRLSVRQNVAMQMGGTGVAEAIATMREFFPVLASRLDQPAGTLSGGEQQMLAFTRALVTNPSVVLADELSSGLAPVVVDRIFAAVDALRAGGVTMVIVEQYVDRVLALADEVVVLHKGHVAFRGTPDDCAGGLFDQYLGGAVPVSGVPGRRQT